MKQIAVKIQSDCVFGEEIGIVQVVECQILCEMLLEVLSFLYMHIRY